MGSKRFRLGRGDLKKVLVGMAIAAGGVALGELADYLATLAGTDVADALWYVVCAAAVNAARKWISDTRSPDQIPVGEALHRMFLDGDQERRKRG